MIPFSFQRGNKVSGCEDAPPIARTDYTIVCDGLGGAGATKHTVTEDETKKAITRTSGYLGSRIVSDSVNKYYDQYIVDLTNMIKVQDNNAVINSFLSILKNTIVTAFDQKMKKWGIVASHSKTLKDFPTTLASAIYMPHSSGITILAVWAGDSRVYVLTPDKGLQLLSLDDAKNAENEMNSASEMTNCISAGNAFRLNYALYELKKPGIIFCCSDGCFDYIQSPLHFEWLLLHTILNCLPNSSGEDLGVAFAESVKNNMYKTIGDDTTMAGVIFGVKSSNDMKCLYQGRMTESEKLAVSINESFKVLKKAQAERDAAQKTCRLFEEKVFLSLHDEVCKSLRTGNENTTLHSRLSTLPHYGEFVRKKNKIVEEIDDECNAKTLKLQEIAYQTKNICRNLLICDILNWRRQMDEQNGSSSFWGQLPLLSQRTKNLSRNNQAYASPQRAKQSLLACKEMYKHPYFREVASLPIIPEEEFTKYIQSQIGLIEALIAIVDNTDSLFLDLWTQAYFSTEYFLQERVQCDKSKEFDSLFEQAMSSPQSCQYVSKLSLRKIEEYQKQLIDLEEIKNKFQNEKQKRLENLSERYWLEHMNEILEWVTSENDSDLHLLFENTSVSVDRLISYMQAKKTLAIINQKIDAAQTEVDEIWKQYKGDYQLFSRIAEKGAC